MYRSLSILGRATWALHASGLDFAVNYEHEIGSLGTFDIGASGSYFLKYDSASAPGAPFVDLLGTILNPADLQMRGYLGWRLGGLDVLASVNRTDGYLNNVVVPNQQVSSYTTFDLHVGYDLPKVLSFSRLRIALDATNLFDRDPPFVNIGPSTTTEGGYDGSQASPVGRILAISLTAKY